MTFKAINMMYAINILFVVMVCTAKFISVFKVIISWPFVGAGS